MTAPARRYTAIAIVLHWAIAAAILFNIPLGLWMHAQAAAGHLEAGVFRAFQLHKSIGLTVLALSLVRLGWRLANPAPSLPAHMPAWERLAAQAAHWAFYVLMIALPLTGWLYVSAGWSAETDHPLVVETHYFNLFTAPFLFGLSHASDATRAFTAHAAILAHWALGWTTLALAGLHVAAALKHQLVDRDDVLGRMTPGVRSLDAPRPAPNAGRNAVLGGGLAIVAVATIAASYALFSAPPQPAAAPAPASTFAIADAASNAMPAPAPSATRTSAPAPAAPTAAAPTAATATPDARPQASSPPPAHAVAWSVDAAASAVAFTITYSGQSYDGAFDRWRADIRFDANDLAHSEAQVTFETASAHTSDQMQTSQIGAEAWLDTQQFPTASFRTSVIRRLGGDNYEAEGALTLKGRTKNVSLPFALDITGNRAVMSGRITLNRQDFGIGAGDASIGDTVAVRVRVVATRAA
jgi:cytochrome b561